ncbi:hypothetical protein PIB30_023667 [Stylosanthes scabra]|uniref:GRF-type domain-containing protein n=1 Tax=Stylosanthes scabra TaxID=79078 RepID=A0ABU6SAA8_9FABA|nr:hypothetical protein [Stylosanthes scabra]
MAGARGNWLIRWNTQSMRNGSYDEVFQHGNENKLFDRTCFYGLGLVVLKSKTRNNSGRLFYRCPRWKNKNGGYNYFKWMDETPNEPVGVEECSVDSNHLVDEFGCFKTRNTMKVALTLDVDL